jgi:CRP-like cAMP-binding protein
MEPQHSFDPHTFLAHVGAGRTLVACQAQSPIFAQGDAADAVFYIQDGQVKLSVVSAARQGSGDRHAQGPGLLW